MGAVEHADFTAVQHQLVDPFLAERIDLASLFFEYDAAGGPIELVTVLESREARSVVAFKLAVAPYDLAQREGTQLQLPRLTGLIERRLDELAR